MKHWHKLLIAGLMVVALAVALALLAPGGRDSLAVGTTIYVDADAGGANDGSSWEDAFTDLQPALDAATSGGQIWVAAGVYTPTTEHGGSGDRYRSFQLKNGVALYGGFDPSVGDVAFEDRDWVLHETILSGDIGSEGDDSDNSYHVFYHPEGTDLDGAAVLDGFAISGGNANGDVFPDQYGGGMFNEESSPTLTNSTFAGNSADYGGGMLNDAHSSPVVTNCVFSGNSAVGFGGGMYNREGSTPMLTNCAFSGNSGGNNGGGMRNYASSPVLTTCTFTGNSAEYGSGMANVGSSPTLTNCTFSHNLATVSGGGMFSHLSSPALTNCTFSGNSANNGGGMANWESSPTLANCIVWDNTPNQISNDSSSPVVTYSDILGGCETIPGNVCGTGNIDAAPLFVDPDNDDLHLGLGSPCIDVGDNAAADLPAFDFEGDHRIVDGNGDGEPVVDMGVDEARMRAYLPLVLRGY